MRRTSFFLFFSSLWITFLCFYFSCNTCYSGSRGVKGQIDRKKKDKAKRHILLGKSEIALSSAFCKMNHFVVGFKLSTIFSFVRMLIVGHLSFSFCFDSSLNGVCVWVCVSVIHDEQYIQKQVDRSIERKIALKREDWIIL